LGIERDFLKVQKSQRAVRVFKNSLRGNWTFEGKLNILGIDGNNGIMEWWNDGFELIEKSFFFERPSIPIFH